MKKLVFLLLTAFAVASCNDDCDHNINSNGGGEEGGDFTYEYLSSGTGSWYEEAENEEFRPTANGKFYDKYCNLKRAAETEGTYEISEKGTRMTQTYKFMGQNQFADWKISNVKEFSFAMSSEQVATHTYEKIVEVYTLAVGQTQKINFATEYPSYSIKSFNSSNEHIASVSSDGTITALGEKGTAYVKITHDQGNVWVKVIVGDNYADLWYDYSNLLDNTYTQMRSLLGEPDQVSTEYGSYSYTTPLHDVINYFNIFINERTQTVEQVDLYLKEGVPSTQIISYMDAHYYTLGESGGTKFYHTSPKYEESRAIFAYVKSSNTVMIVPAGGFLDLWKDFTPLFGQESDNIKILTAQLHQNFKLGPLHWENVVTYQKSDNKNVLPLPDWNIFSNLYLKFRIAKVLGVELGADATYFSKYFAPDFCPGLNQFAVQKNEESRVELGGYPFVDVYANMALKGVRFFLVMSNVVNGGGNHMKFLTPHYPTNGSVLHCGVSWPFFN